MAGDTIIVSGDQCQFANLDDAGERSLLEAVADLRRSNKTVILITHRPSILGAADLLVVMRDGRILHCGPRNDVLAALNPKNTTPKLSKA